MFQLHPREGKGIPNWDEKKKWSGIEMPKIKEKEDSYDIEMGKFQIFFIKRYELLSTINDLTLGLWFLLGSIFFLFDATQTAGAYMFVLGSAQLMGRPILKLMRAFYIKKNPDENKKTE